MNKAFVCDQIKVLSAYKTIRFLYKFHGSQKAKSNSRYTKGKEKKSKHFSTGNYQLMKEDNKGRRKEPKNCQKSTKNMLLISPYLSITTLNKNRLYSFIKSIM